ncbi:hypothetical protein D3C71_1381510 [compost metagenome]
MRDVRDQHIGRTFLDMQAFVADVEFGLECLAQFAIESLDALFELEYGVGRRQHGVGVGAHHV